jgi:hypothetical protein
MLRLLIVLFFCCTALLLHAQPRVPQNQSNLRKKLIATTGVILLDTMSVVPNTINVAGVPDSFFVVDPVNATLTWKTKPLFDTVLVSYRIFNYRLNSTANRLKYDSVMNFFIAQPAIFNTQGRADDNFFNFGNITYSGSFGRGIAFGNAQDAVVNSTFNLQLSGFLADSIEISAAITDNNIPIQPDGTTQQLNEFDRIFLQFKKRNWNLSLGDIDLRQQKNYFLNFYKRLQGGSFETMQQFGKRIINNSLVSASIAKGKFTRNIFDGQEGNQGPYRLQGANNEFYFVVLGGTERVFIDGLLLQRGEDQDYVINYNTAEITFTPKRLISKDSRIQVEFEYADRNYLNANLYFANNTQVGKKLLLRMAAFQNSDAKNSPINQTLDAPQKNFLKSIGDSITRAFYPTALIDTFAAGKILYKKTDTIYNLTQESIYVYSTNPDSAKYNLSFIDVGLGNGSYVPDFSGANGKVFKWVQPVNGVKQGNYDAVSFLVTPKRQQVATIGADYNLGSNTLISTDFGYSNYDVNQFADKDKGNDKGYAAKINIKNALPINKTKGKTLTSNAGIEWVHARFKPLERLRNVEFGRDWSLPYLLQPAEELLYNAGLQLADAKNNSLKYELTGYNRGDGYRGLRNSIYHLQTAGAMRFSNTFNYTTSNSNINKGYFARGMFDVARTFKKLNNYVTGVSYNFENNEIRNKISDSVTALSFAFDILQVYLKSNELKPNKWGITYFTRSDKYPVDKNLKRADRSQNINVFTEILSNEHHQLRVNATYRKLNVFDKTIARNPKDETLLGRIQYDINEWKGLVTGNILYEVGAGQEQKRDYAYLAVPAGQGLYTWIDYNNNGAQELNEFEIAQFTDQAKYIRIFTPTNQFIKANYNSFNYSFSLDPRAVIEAYKAKGIKKFISKINLRSSLQLFKKEISSGLIKFNPFSGALTDTSLISLNSILVNSLVYNRFSSKWGFDVTNTNNNNKQILTYGLETRTLKEWSMRTRWNITRMFSIDVTFKTGNNKLTTTNIKFDNRNYSVSQQSVEPRVSYTRGTNFRFSTSYKFNKKNNIINEKEKYNANSLFIETKYNVLQNTSLLSKFTYSNIGYKGNANTTVGYIMLDGLQPGKNFLWSLDLTRRLSNSIELSIQYEGRKPGVTRIINTGRASLRAIL